MHIELKMKQLKKCVFFSHKALKQILQYVTSLVVYECHIYHKWSFMIAKTKNPKESGELSSSGSRLVFFNLFIKIRLYQFSRWWHAKGRFMFTAGCVMTLGTNMFRRQLDETWHFLWCYKGNDFETAVDVETVLTVARKSSDTLHLLE